MNLGSVSCTPEFDLGRAFQWPLAWLDQASALLRNLDSGSLVPVSPPSNPRAWHCLVLALGWFPLRGSPILISMGLASACCWGRSQLPCGENSCVTKGLARCPLPTSHCSAAPPSLPPAPSIRPKRPLWPQVREQQELLAQRSRASAGDEAENASSHLGLAGRGCRVKAAGSLVSSTVKLAPGPASFSALPPLTPWGLLGSGNHDSIACLTQQM